MTLQLYWFLPGHGDGRDIGRATEGGPMRSTQRAPDLGYLTQVAMAADQLGFAGALVPFGMFCEDPWLVSAAVAAQTERLRLMIALRPGLMSPLLAAQMTATLQRMSGNRVVFNVVIGSDRDEQLRYGDPVPHDDRHRRSREFLHLLRALWAGEPVDFDGDFYQLKAGLLTRPAEVFPELHIAGSSEAAQQTAATYGDVFMTWGEPPPALASSIADVRDRLEQDRPMVFGTRFHVITRDTEDEAWALADRLVSGLDPALIAKAQKRFSATESEGQRRMSALYADGVRPSRAELEVHPNLWAGYGLARPGPGLALVGRHDQVADRIAELHALGIDHLILSSQPHLEECYWFGENVIPLLRDRGVVA